MFVPPAEGGNVGFLNLSLPEIVLNRGVLSSVRGAGY